MNKTEKLIDAGRVVATKYVEANANRLVPLYFPNELPHVIDILTSALQTKYGYGYEGGSFVRHLVDNKLYESLAAADHIIQKYIVLLAAGVYHIPPGDIEKEAGETIDDK